MDSRSIRAYFTNQVNRIEALTIRPVNAIMLSLPSFLAFLLPLPASRQVSVHRRRRRAVAALHLAPHLLRDAGLDDYESPADDPRWVRRFDLER